METFNFRMSLETREKLDKIAKKYRRSRGNIICLLIEAEDGEPIQDREIFDEPFILKGFK